MAVDFQDEDKSGTEKVARNPNNYNILKGGKVDKRSKLYQRSLEGREKLSDYLNRLWNDGGDEADVFMAGVKSLMNRGHGYVGAYLDSKNPGRRYTDNQAKAIVDQVMTDEGIGEHPGARLTRPKAEDDSPEAKEKAKQARATRKEANVARGYGPQQAPGRKAMPVGQQRKLGKRESTGQPLEDSRRPGREGGSAGSQAVKEERQKYFQPVAKEDGRSVDVERKWQDGLKRDIDAIKKAEAGGELTPEEAKNKLLEVSKKWIEEGKKYRQRGVGAQQAVEKQREKRKKDRTAAPEEAGGTATPEIIDEKIATPEEKTKWKAPGEGREDRSSVEEAKTGVAGASGSMLSAQSTPVIGPWSRNEREYKQSITDTFDRLLNQEIQFQYDDIKGIRDPRQKNSIRNKIYSDPKELEFIFKDTIRDFISKDDSLKGTDFDKFARDHLNRLVALRTGQEIEPERPIQQPPLEEAKRTAQDRQAQATDEDVMRRATLLGGKKPQAGPEEQAAPAAPKRKPSKRGFGALVPEQPAPRGGDPFTVSSKPSPEQIKAIKEKVAKVPKEQLIKEMEQGTLFPAGLVAETSQTNPLEGGSTGVGAPDTEQPVEQKTPEETGDSLLDEEGAAKDFRKSGPEKPKPSAKKPTQRSIRGLGPSAGKFDTTRTQKAGDELLTQDLKSYGFTPKQVKEIQKSGLTEKERQTITQRRQKTQEEKAKQAPKVAEERSGGLLDGEDQAKDFRKSGPQTPAKPTGGKRTRGPLDQFAKVVMSGIERDKAARENASQFLDRVSKLIRERAGGNVSKSDADQAAATAINQQKGRTTRNKTGKKGVSNNAEYQEFAQSIRSLMR